MKLSDCLKDPNQSWRREKQRVISGLTGHLCKHHLSPNQQTEASSFQHLVLSLSSVLTAPGSLAAAPTGTALLFYRLSGLGQGSCTAALPCPYFTSPERFLNGLQKPLGTRMSTRACKMSLVNVFLLTLCFAPCLPEFPVTYLKYHSLK